LLLAAAVRSFAHMPLGLFRSQHKLICLFANYSVKAFLCEQTSIFLEVSVIWNIKSKQCNRNFKSFLSDRGFLIYFLLHS